MPLGPHGTLILEKTPTSSPKTIFIGHPSFWAGLPDYLKSFLVLLIGLGAMAYGYFDKAGKLPKDVDHLLIVVGAVLWVMSIAIFAFGLLKVSSMRYCITTALIERQTGVFQSQTDSLDLARVKDVQLQQSFIDRNLGLGTIVLLSSDATDPLLAMESMPQARTLYEAVRDAVIRIDRSRGIVSMS